jgi:hypothetical protein
MSDLTGHVGTSHTKYKMHGSQRHAQTTPQATLPNMHAATHTVGRSMQQHMPQRLQPVQHGKPQTLLAHGTRHAQRCMQLQSAAGKAAPHVSVYVMLQVTFLHSGP